MSRVWPIRLVLRVRVSKMLVSGYIQFCKIFFFFLRIWVVEKGGGSGPLGPPLWIRPCTGIHTETYRKAKHTRHRVRCLDMVGVYAKKNTTSRRLLTRLSQLGPPLSSLPRTTPPGRQSPVGVNRRDNRDDKH